MSDALEHQNISRHMISCLMKNRTVELAADETNSNTNDDDDDEAIPLTDKFELFRDYYTIAADRNKISNVASYPLNLTSFLPSNLSPHLATFVNALSLCSIRAYRSHFIANRTEFGKFDFFAKLNEKNFAKGFAN